MKAVRFDRYGDIEVLHVVDVPVPEPAQGQVVPDIPRMQAAFADLCRDAAKHGTAIVLEIMPFGNVRTIEDGRAIVEGANQPNGFLLLDIWHMARGGMHYSKNRRDTAALYWLD
jgi:sugar phosphate isomerase/epimerase